MGSGVYPAPRGVGTMEFIDFPKELLYICYTSWGKGETEKTKENRENQGKQRKTKEFA